MERYQDYVIKDGKFVGRFDEMYERFEDPWHQGAQEARELSKSRAMTLLNIQKYKIGSVTEFGCGLGHFSHLIKTRTRAHVIGVDISPTAVRKASQSYPDIRFSVDTVRNLHVYAGSEAILFAEITWYILPDLRFVFDEMLKYCRGKFFLHNLVFYKGNMQKYGREFFSTFEEFAFYCPFQLLEHGIATTNEPESTIETSAVFRIETR